MTPPASAASPLPWTEIVAAFGLPGRVQSAASHGNGHINDTYAVALEGEGRVVRYLFQKINHRIFRDVPALMDNIARVTAHAQGQLRAARVADAARRALALVPATGGKPYWQPDADSWWRCYHFVEGTSSHDVVAHPGQAREAARAFGEFQRSLVDLPGPRLHETIPQFHDTRRRFERLRAAVAADTRGRAQEVAADIAFAFSRESMVDRLLALHAAGDLPERITHNDTKLNNVMLDNATGQGVCVIDLDTVMPGLVAWDFGDMVRTATTTAKEDETDLMQVDVRLPVFEALAEGFLASAGHFLNPAERRELVFGGRLMTYENGIRFLTDYLEGDVYYKIKRPSHNLDRARNQFALLRRLEHHAVAMETVVQRLSEG